MPFIPNNNIFDMFIEVTNSCYEFILVLEDDLKAGRMIQNATFERGLFNNILRIGRPKKISKEHGAVFPVKLAEEIISNFSKKGDIVLDPFIGSGTTAVACKKLHRKYIGFEISPEYCKIISERLSQQVLSNSSGFIHTSANADPTGHLIGIKRKPRKVSQIPNGTSLNSDIKRNLKKCYK